MTVRLLPRDGPPFDRKIGKSEKRLYARFGDDGLMCMARGSVSQNVTFAGSGLRRGSPAGRRAA